MFTAIETIPSMKGKTRDLRVLFADTVNEALTQGRSESEAIFKALNVVKLKEQQSIKKFTPQAVPAHLSAILNVRSASNLAQEAQEQLEKEKAAPWPTSLSAQISPPWRRTMRCTEASPTPVPGKSLLLCRR